MSGAAAATGAEAGTAGLGNANVVVEGAGAGAADGVGAGAGAGVELAGFIPNERVAPLVGAGVGAGTFVSDCEVPFIGGNETKEAFDCSPVAAEGVGAAGAPKVSEDVGCVVDGSVPLFDGGVVIIAGVLFDCDSI